MNFYQTMNPDVAKLFHMDPNAKRPALVMVKREDEKLSHFGMFQFCCCGLLFRILICRETIFPLPRFELILQMVCL